MIVTYASHFDVFPNSCTDYRLIDLAVEDANNVSVKIVSVKGSIVFENHYSRPGQIHFTTDVLAVGLYRIVVTTEKGITNFTIYSEIKTPREALKPRRDSFIK